MTVLFQDVFYAKDIDDYLKNIWKKHPDEASEAYDYFIRYYVANDTTIEGYRLFLLDKGLLDEEDSNNIQRPSPKFLNYERSKDSEGNHVESLHVFKDRKKAFKTTGIKTPPRLIETSIDDIKKLRVSIVRQELLDADILLDQWLLQMAVFSEHVDEQKGKKEMATGQNSATLGNMTKARRDISFIFRRAAGMSDKAEESILEEAVEQEVMITYHEELIDVTQFEPIDFATLESFEEIIGSTNYEEAAERLSKEYDEAKDKKS